MKNFALLKPPRHTRNDTICILFQQSFSAELLLVFSMRGVSNSINPVL